MKTWNGVTITFNISGFDKTIFISHIGFLEEAPGKPGATRMYVQGVPLIVPGTPEYVIGQIAEALAPIQEAPAKPAKKGKKVGGGNEA